MTTADPLHVLDQLDAKYAGLMDWSLPTDATVAELTAHVPLLTAAVRAVLALADAQPVHEGFATVIHVADIRSTVTAALAGEL